MDTDTLIENMVQESGLNPTQQQIFLNYAQRAKVGISALLQGVPAVERPALAVLGSTVSQALAMTTEHLSPESQGKLLRLLADEVYASHEMATAVNAFQKEPSATAVA